MADCCELPAYWLAGRHGRTGFARRSIRSCPLRGHRSQCHLPLRSRNPSADPRLSNEHQQPARQLRPMQFHTGHGWQTVGDGANRRTRGGAVFSLDFGLPKPLPSVAQLMPASGSVGQKVLLWGAHLLGATSVKFNGVPATIVLIGSTQAVTVTVPEGPTTGPVTFTTANGSSTTKQSFTVH